VFTISYPEPDFRTRKEEGVEYIFDGLRRKWLCLTPEEWVRQNFIQFLIREAAYPATLIAQEKAIRLGELKKRFDILVYNRSHQPWMIVECKSHTVRLTNDVLEQALRYNISVPVPYIVITNGAYCFAAMKEKGKLIELEALPVLD
jgi:hypothetical protein